MDTTTIISIGSPIVAGLVAAVVALWRQNIGHQKRTEASNADMRARIRHLEDCRLQDERERADALRRTLDRLTAAIENRPDECCLKRRNPDTDVILRNERRSSHG